jgi:SsrA-binding protein
MRSEGGAVPREKGRKVVASNRKARHDYSILDTFEAASR